MKGLSHGKLSGRIAGIGHERKPGLLPVPPAGEGIGLCKGFAAGERDPVNTCGCEDPGGEFVCRNRKHGRKGPGLSLKHPLHRFGQPCTQTTARLPGPFTSDRGRKPARLSTSFRRHPGSLN